MLRLFALPLLLALCAPVFAGEVNWVSVSTVEDVKALAEDVDSVKVTDGDEAEVLKKLAELRPELKRLNIASLDKNSDGLPSLKEFTKIEELTITGSMNNGCEKTHRKRFVETVGSLTTLTTLNVNNNLDFCDKSLKGLAGLVNIEHLTFRGY